MPTQPESHDAISQNEEQNCLDRTSPKPSGYPQDWIRTLGKSIVKVHLKDFKRKQDGYEWVNLGDGDVDWAAVRQAFADIGYSGSAVTELRGGDEAYLRDVSRRVDRLVLGRG